MPGAELLFKNHTEKAKQLEQKRLKEEREKERKRKKNSSASSESEGSPETTEGEQSGDSDKSDIEDLPDYKENGYHAVHIGEIMESRYIVLKKLGWGHFSTVWLAFSLSDKKIYALKILKSHKKYLDSAFDEEGICKIIADNY